MEVIVTTLSSLVFHEAEYVVVTDAFKEEIWLRGILDEIQMLHRGVTISFDSQSALHLSKNPMYHERNKHVDVKYHFVKDQIVKGIVQIQKVLTKENQANMGTKIITATKFKHCLDLLHVKVGK